MKTQETRSETQWFATPHVSTISAMMIALACVLSLLLFRTTVQTSEAYREMIEATDNYLVCIQAAADLKDASNYLTTQSRMFAVTQNAAYAENYFSEELNTRRREAAVEVITEHLGDVAEKTHLDQALSYSNTLAEREHYAIRLVMDAMGIEPEGFMTPIINLELTPEDAALSWEEKLALGESMLFDDTYQEYKTLIENNVSLCTAGLIVDTRLAKQTTTLELENTILVEKTLTIAFLLVVIATAGVVLVLVLKPLEHYTKQIMEGRMLNPEGAYDVRYLAEAYNAVYEENQRRSERLRHAAEHDPLTGLLNRGAYDVLSSDYTDHTALLLIDVDHFKEVNDTYGHDIGDAVLKKVASLLTSAFRASDYPCRIGGDEFAVIMTGITPDLSHVIEDKIAQLTKGLSESDGKVPPVTLSIGIAFSEELRDRGDDLTVFKAADQALYTIKEAGRNGHQFFGKLQD